MEGRQLSGRGGGGGGGGGGREGGKEGGRVMSILPFGIVWVEKGRWR